MLRIDQEFDHLRFAQGCIQATLNQSRETPNLRDYEFKVFSQWGEDGLIQRLIDVLPIAHKTFIEFGVEDFREANCRFLMQKDNWSGLVIDGSKRNVSRILKSASHWRHDLQAVCAFVTTDNIENIIESGGFDPDIGILSVDIDGVDYFVLEAIRNIQPRIIIVEYNSIFGPDRAISVPYDSSFDRSRKHYSHMYFGASLAAFAHLAERRGYSLVGGTSQGVNAFFVRNDLLNDRTKPVLVSEAYIESRFRDSRDRRGRLNFVRPGNRYELIQGMPVVNVVTGLQEEL